MSFSATATDPDNDTRQYRFVFGDGSDSGWQAASTVQHAYTAIGRYRAQVQVRDGNGGQTSRAATASVLPPAPGALPVASSSIAVDAANDRAFVVNPDADTLARIDLITRQRNAEFSTCADPRSAARDGSGRIWVTCFDADRLQAFHPDSGTLLAEIDKLDIDLVVMGSHGRGGLYKAFVGSVSEQLLHTSEVPVLIIPDKNKKR